MRTLDIRKLASWVGGIFVFFYLSNTYADSLTSDEMISQLKDLFRNLADISSDLSIIFGVILFIGGLFSMKRYGEMRTMMSTQMTLSKPLGPMVAGILLITFPTALGTLMQAFWGSGWHDPSPLPTGDDEELISVIFSMVRLIGVISFIRAFISAPNSLGAHAQPGAKTKVGVLFLSGVLCVNVTGVVHMLNTFFHFSSTY